MRMGLLNHGMGLGARPASAAGGGGSDPDFASVVLLAGFNGDFTDDSNSNHTPTTAGSISTGLTNAKFAGNEVAQCPGADEVRNTHYWTYPSSTDFVLEMTDDWTIEFFVWIDPDAPWQAHYSVLIWFDASGTISLNSATGFGLFRRRSGLGDDFVWRNIRGTTIKQDVQGIGPFTDSTWHHMAAVNDGATNTVEIFFDGVTQGSNAGDATALGITPMFSGARANSSSGIPLSQRPLDHKGKLEELRVTKGVKRYTSNFTPPSAPFPRS